MKKTALTILLAALSALASNAQSAYDAWLFSENNYEGTARSVAMGNAFTALGGDLGAVSINPAGSAVAGYSQFTLTPALSISTNITTGQSYNEYPATYFQSKQKSSMTRVGLPNIGFTLNFNTGRKSGVKSYSMGFIANRTNSWNEDLFARGTNNETSFLAAAAADAQAEIQWMNNHKAPGEADFTASDFLSDQVYRYMNWKDVVCYRGGLFSSIDEEGKKFAGATENILKGGAHTLAGEVDQRYGRSVSGNKYEYIFNLGANISDFLYLGFNLGINSINYNYSHYFKEGAANGNYEEFENVFIDDKGTEYTTYFKNAKYNYTYSAEGTGVFAKFGFILTPGNGLRIGAAIQTPTATTIYEEWQEGASTSFTDSSFDGSEESEVGGNEYRLRSPWRANFGAAYTLGRFAVISADYEIAGYGNMKYNIDRYNMSDDTAEYFEMINDDIKNMYGAAHYLRLGAEVKPFAELAVRCGYNLSTSARTHEYDADYDEYYKLDRIYGHNVSVGFGYSSKKSFFADLACRYTLPAKEYILPYSDYLASTNGALPPEILNIHSNWKILLTLGWRF